MLKNDVVKLCQENGFKSGFFGGSDNNYVVDAYELKVAFLSIAVFGIFTLGFWKIKFVSTL